MKKTFIILAVMPLLFFSCKSKQLLTEQKVSKSPIGQLVEKVKTAEPSFTTANVSKMSLAIAMNDRKFNVSASCRISRDSLIHISILPVLGIEAFKVEIDRDSVKVFDKLNGKLYAIDFGLFSRSFGVNVDFYSLQALISNRFFKVGTSNVNADNCKLIESAETTNVILYEKQPLKQTITINATDRITENEIATTKSGSKMTTSYGNFTPFDNIIFPQKIGINVINGKNRLNCEFGISKVVFNQKINFSFLDPGKYERADINSLLKK